MGTMLQGQALANLVAGAAATVKLRHRADPFSRSMKGSIASFYDDLEQSRGDITGSKGRAIVELCERITHRAGLPPRATKAQHSIAGNKYEVLVVGGTGFIGAHCVARLSASGRSVGVLARGIDNLPDHFSAPGVTLIRGDARRREDVMRAIDSCDVVVNLAHGGGGGSRAETEENLVGAARTIAEGCLEAGVRRLIYVSSIASLYLGDASVTVTGATPPDPEYEARADYSRAKTLAELEMFALNRSRGLPVVLLRPGVVIGEGGIIFHSGVGFYNHERHCLGWNDGSSPLPLVLVEDVAEAITRAIDTPGIEGKSYNLVGDVRFSARDYIDELARVTGRPLRYHPQSVIKLYGIEMMKALIKRMIGRRDPPPSLRDLKSRGLVATFDCSDAVRDLGWKPVADRAEFLRKGFEVHGGTA